MDFADVVVGDSDMRTRLAPIIEMLDGPLDSTLEAVRALAQLSSNDENRFGMIGIVSRLAKLLADATAHEGLDNQILFFTVTTLANLSEHPLCQEGIIGAGVLPMLLRNVANGCYLDWEMRRESVRCISNLALEHGAVIRQALARLDNKLSATLAQIKDPDLRAQVETLQGRLQTVSCS